MSKTNKVFREHYDLIPKSVELFGRTLKTVDDSNRMNILRQFGEARCGVNEIAISHKVSDKDIPNDELKLTYLHEMFHFILNFTGYENILRDTGKVDIEQFIELMSAAIYQYEKSAKY